MSLKRLIQYRMSLKRHADGSDGSGSRGAASASATASRNL